MPVPISKTIVRREVAFFFVLLFVGFVIVPAAIFLVGQQIFGEFGGQGYADFFGTLSGKVRRGEPVAWFFILAPYLSVQTLRLTWRGWRHSSRSPV